MYLCTSTKRGLTCLLGHHNTIDMGASPSSPRRKPSRPSRFPSLSRTGRYAVLASPSGVPVHVLGVYPCSRASEEEAADLIAAVRPRALYLDLFPELLAALREDVKAGRLPAEDGSPWPVPSAAPPWPAGARTAGAGWVDSSFLRVQIADNEMFALLGGETLGAYKAALRAGEALRQPPLRVRAFPFEMSHRNYEAIMRPLDLAGLLTGDMSWNSTRVGALVGMPHAWMLVSAGSPQKNAPDVDHAVQLPASGYFTRGEVEAGRASFRAAVARAAEKATAANHDMDADLLERETEARAGGDVAGAELLARQALLAQACASASAYVLQEMAGEVEVEGGEGGGSGGGGKEPPPAIVAIVNLGSMGALTRNWENAKPPAEALPPFQPWERAVSYGLTAATGGGMTYGLYRAGRRFPRATAAFVALAGVPVAALMYTFAHQEAFRYGTTVRAALATPRVVSPLARMNK